MKPLYEELARFSAEMDTVEEVLTEKAEISAVRLALKKLFRNEKQAFDHFEAQRDEEFEQASLDTDKVRKHLQKLEERSASEAQRIGSTRLSDLFARNKQQKETNEFEAEAASEELSEDSENSIETEETIEEEIEAKEFPAGKQESFALNIVLNNKQQIAAEFAEAGKTFCLIGAAGTGKTTAQRAVAERLLMDNKLSISRFRTYNSNGEREYKSAPSIAFCAFTRRAAANLQKAVHKSPILAEKLQHNIMTIHALLEYEPENYEDYDDEGKLVTKFRFIPRRDASNPLDITHLVIEEASMLDAYELWKKLYEALPPGVQIIFIGDINQLPPVFGPSILNYALVQLPIVELTEVYRNQGIVLENAHNILAGKSLVEDHNFIIVRGKKAVQMGQNLLAKMYGNLFNQWMDIKGSDGLPEYDPEDCIILSPFNRQDLGTINMNNWIAQHLGDRRKAIVHEVIAGFAKLYLAVGDRVMVNKMDGVITDIYRNPDYSGREPQIAGSDLTRFGVRVLGQQGQDALDDVVVDYSNFSLQALEEQKGERKQQASHEVVVLLDNGKEERLKGAGDFGEQVFSLGYALTVHKAQGSEWRKVFIILHKDHATMLYRELFYTAVTRARTKVTIIAKDNVINKAIENQRIKGNSIQDKIEYFNAGILNGNGREPVYATKN